MNNGSVAKFNSSSVGSGGNATLHNGTWNSKVELAITVSTMK
jgi:hypothetical protein